MADDYLRAWTHEIIDFTVGERAQRDCAPTACATKSCCTDTGWLRARVATLLDGYRM